MPILPTSYANVPPQVSPTTQPGSTQLNFRQMVGRLTQWSPELDPTVAQSFIQNAYRRVIDERNWYGLLVKGQVVVPNAYSTGTALVTFGSQNVTLSGTASIDSTFVGRQFRVGFSNPIYTIQQVTGSTTFTLDLPWGGQTQSAVAYNIFQNIVSLGYNVKRVLAMVNQNQGFRLKLGMPQEVLNIYDTWRTQTGWTYMLASYVPSQLGAPQWELYPAPTFQQGFPFLAYVQPPDLQQDGDFPYTFIRSDVILYGAMVDALLFRGKRNPYYDPQAAQYYQARYNAEIQKMANSDSNQNNGMDLMWEFERYPFTSFGADFYQTHDSGMGYW